MKKELRQKYLNLRKAQKQEELSLKSQILCQHLILWLKNKNFKQIFCYSAFRQEPCLLELFKSLASSYQFFLPHIASKNKMDFYPWQEDINLQKNSLGILEPTPCPLKKAFPNKETLILVPALAVDAYGQRLGYGGGYYDRYLSSYPEVKTIAVTFDFAQSLQNLPVNSFDQLVSFIASEKGVKARKQQLCQPLPYA